jgi:hypothetical protein
MVAVSNDIKAKVLADFKSGKATQAALSKTYGISRYAVGRIVKSAGSPNGSKDPQGSKEPQKEPKVEAKAKAEAKVKVEEEPDDDDDDDDDEDDDDNFFMRNQRFAEDLGLAEPSRVGAGQDDKPKVDEETIDAMMSNVVGSLSGSPTITRPDFPSGGLMDAITQPRVIPKSFAQPRGLARQEEEEVIDRDDIIQKIIFNVNHFGPHLEVIIGKPSEHQAFIMSLNTKTSMELKNLLQMLERTRSVGTISSGFRQVFYGVAQGVEVASSLVGVKSEGFSDQLRQQDEEITMILKEIALQEWQRLKELDSPQARLGMLFCLTLFQTHTRNQIASVISKAKSTVDPDLVERTKDL